MEETKVCAYCKTPKLTGEFHKNSKSKDGLKGQCKVCESALTRKRQFGLSPEQLSFLFKHQENRCAVCRDPLGLGKNVHVDHDHITDKVRGLLCDRCNKGLGHMRDSITLLQNAAEYLSQPPLELPQKIETCESCERDHDGSYGSGRFCSRHCARVPSSGNLIDRTGMKPAASTIAAIIESNKLRKGKPGHSKPAWNKGVKGSTWKKRHLQESLTVVQHDTNNGVRTPLE